MAIMGYLDTHHVFTLQEFTRTFPDSVTDRNLLIRAVGNGRVDRVRRGVYVSRTGQFGHTEADPFDVAQAVAHDAIFCYLSALQLHGVLHNVVTVTQFYTAQRLSCFDYSRHTYVPRRIPSAPIDTQTLLTPRGFSYRVTTREQTIVDCITTPALAGGPESLLRSLSGMTYVDPAKLAGLIGSASRNTRAKLGWLLSVKRDEWAVPDALLEELKDSVRGGPYYFWSSRPPKDNQWVNKWKVYLPYPEQEMITWLNQ